MTWQHGKANENHTNEWATPKDVVRPLADAVGGFDLDPTSGAEQTPHAAETYTKDDDGLHSPWFGQVWCNPPFAEKDKWLKKAIDERDNYERCIMLIPVDTSTGWFHSYVTEADCVCFDGSRISFVKPDGTQGNSPNFGTMFVVFGDLTDELLTALEKRGSIFVGPVESTEQTTAEDWV